MRVLLLLALIVAACDEDASPPPAESIRPLPTEEAAAPPKPVVEPSVVTEASPGSDPFRERTPRETVPTLDELLERLGEGDHPDARPAPRGTLADAITEGYEDVADVYSAIAVNDAGAFIILSANTEESGHSVVTLLRHDRRGERRLLSFSAWGAPVPALRRQLRRYGSLPMQPSIVGVRAYWEFSLDAYAPLAALTGPLAGWLLWYETTGIEDREQRLHLMRPDGSEARILATRDAPVGSCEGGGYWCAINETDLHAECTAAMLEAEGKLCTHPAKINQVQLSPNGTMFVMGTVVHPGHDGYSRSDWFVELPEDVTMVASPND